MTLQAYHSLVASKGAAFEARGLTKIPDLNPAMFPHQSHATEFALRAGCAAMFLDTGLGKSLCALDWGRVIVEQENRPVLMLAPLAVSAQHQREAEKFGIDAKAVREPSEIAGARVYITNYERLERFEPSAFAGIVLDESSILKSFTGSTTRALIAAFARTPYRLACTATPAPNDHMELGNHAEFLGVMRQSMMLQRWFIHDSADTGNWRMKRHAVEHFWNWVASWARCIARPSDLGFSDDGFALPELVTHRHIVRTDPAEGVQEVGLSTPLFRMPSTSATSIHREKRITAEARADRIAELVAAEPDEPWVIWCDTNYEADALAERMPDAIEVRGSMSPDEKEDRLVAFSTGGGKIITKPSIAGFGLNWQHCARMAFVGLSFSYESYYQAIRRCWRFGQARPVHAHVAYADTEEPIWTAVNRKAADHDSMKLQMTAAMRRAVQTASPDTYEPARAMEIPAWV